MRRILLPLLIVFIFLSGCTFPAPNSLRQETTPMKSIRYLALGDSYTIGEGVKDEERFPEQLAMGLSNTGFTVQTDILARTGWTTDELWQGIQSGRPTPPYDLVTLLIGVNDQYRGRDLSEYQLEFGRLLEKATTLAGGDPSRVIVLSIPDWGVTLFAQGAAVSTVQIAAQIDEFNAVNQMLAEEKGARYVNVTGISRQAAGDSSLLAKDGLHPSALMYAKWIELLLPVALSRLDAP
jgi:lysophospholipase L1-like esterase